MLVDCPLETHAALQALATASARMYPEFAYELETESGMKVDLRDQGTIVFARKSPPHEQPGCALENLLPSRRPELEPPLAASNDPAVYPDEASFYPNGITRASLKARNNHAI